MMGGKGSGGLRVGAGRKSKSDHVRWLGGNAGKRGGRAAGQRPPPPSDVVLIPAPRSLSASVRAVWDELAPYACAQRTLIDATVEGFVQLCQRIVLLRKMSERIDQDGLMEAKVSLQMDEKGGGLQVVQNKSHDLLTKYLTTMQRVDAGMQRFRLLPMGKEIAPPEPPKDDPFKVFDPPSAPAVN